MASSGTAESITIFFRKNLRNSRAAIKPETFLANRPQQAVERALNCSCMGNRWCWWWGEVAELWAGLPSHRHEVHLTLLSAQQAPAFLTYLPPALRLLIPLSPLLLRPPLLGCLETERSENGDNGGGVHHRRMKDDRDWGGVCVCGVGGGLT